MARQRIVIKMTDLESGAEHISGELTVVPGYGFCSCSHCCTTSSLTSVVQPTEVAALTQAIQK
jgi:hypothetical protein